MTAHRTLAAPFSMVLEKADKAGSDYMRFAPEMWGVSRSPTPS
jgi:hypothetical protein